MNLEIMHFLILRLSDYYWSYLDWELQTFQFCICRGAGKHYWELTISDETQLFLTYLVILCPLKVQNA